MTATAAIETHELADGLWWFHDCHEEGGRHMHVSQYLLETGDGYVLVDAGSENREALLEQLRSFTGGEGIDALLLTHSILPHTGNVDPIQAAFDDVDVVSAALVPAVVGLDDARPHSVNDTETIAGETFTFMDPLLTDVVVSSWFYHHESGTLFTAEGVGHYHDAGDCDRISGEYDDGIPAADIHEFAADKLQFLEYVDPGKLDLAFGTLLSEYDIERIAPAHGNPIEGDDIVAYVNRLVAAADEVEMEPSA